MLAQYVDRPMTNYTRAGGGFRTEFGPGTSVQWNRPAASRRVVVDGRLIFNGQGSRTRLANCVKFWPHMLAEESAKQR